MCGVAGVCERACVVFPRVLCLDPMPLLLRVWCKVFSLCVYRVEVLTDNAQQPLPKMSKNVVWIFGLLADYFTLCNCKVAVMQQLGVSVLRACCRVCTICAVWAA